MWRMGVKKLGAGLWSQVGKGRVAKILGDQKKSKDAKNRLLQERKVGFHCQEVTGWPASK